MTTDMALLLHVFLVGSKTLNSAVRLHLGSSNCRQIIIFDNSVCLTGKVSVAERCYYVYNLHT